MQDLNKIYNDIDGQVKTIILSQENSNNILAIYAIGSYGSKELRLDIKTKKVKIENDLDIIIITDSAFEMDLESTTKLKLIYELSFVDIYIETPLNFKKRNNSILTFDIYNSARLIHGEDFRQIDKYIKIPKGDLSVYLLNRLAGINICKKKLRLHSEDDYKYQLVKLIIAIGDILLIKTDNYNSSYSIRLKNINNIDSIDTNLFKKCYQYKLGLTDNININDLDVLKVLNSKPIKNLIKLSDLVIFKIKQNKFISPNIIIGTIRSLIIYSKLYYFYKKNNYFKINTKTLIEWERHCH